MIMYDIIQLQRAISELFWQRKAISKKEIRPPEHYTDPWKIARMSSNTRFKISSESDQREIKEELGVTTGSGSMLIQSINNGNYNNLLKGWSMCN